MKNELRIYRCSLQASGANGGNFVHLLSGSLFILLFVFVIVGVCLWTQPAFAALGDGTCIGDRFYKETGGHLTCTANDVRIAEAVPGSIKDLQGKTLDRCNSGQTFSFIADFRVVLNSQARYDIGLYFATDGDPNHDGALSGTCGANIISPFSNRLGSPNFINLDPSPDICGDIDSSHNPQIVTVRVDNVLCEDIDGNGQLDLSACTSWRQTGANQVCKGPLDAYPGSPSKCNCNMGFNVPIFVDTGNIEVTKDASPTSLPEPGGQFTYNVTVTNNGQFTSRTIDSICDDLYGLVAKVASAPDCPAGAIGTIDETDCVVPNDLAAGDSYLCSFKAKLNGEPQTKTDTVTVNGHDTNNLTNTFNIKASAQVAITDLSPTAQVIKSLNSLQCAIVRYGVRVNNTDPVDELTLTDLTDSGFGNITAVHDDVVAKTCSVPQTIAVGGHYTCTFDAKFCGSSHINKVTGTLNDNDGGDSLYQDSNELTVGVSAEQQ